MDALEVFARSLNKRRIFALLDFKLGASGLITGGRLAELLAKNLGDMRVDDLDQKFVCVATELGTGHEIWLRSGSLVDALRASYALPGIFAPVRIGGRWLVDGALVNPVPVSVCRALGARVVIAVNLHTDIFGRGATVVHQLPAAPMDELPDNDETSDEPGSGWFNMRSVLARQFFGRGDGLPGISGVMMEAFNIIQDRIARSRLAGDPPDILIAPRLGTIGLFDFYRAEEAIAIGYETGRRMVDEVAELVAALSD